MNTAEVIIFVVLGIFLIFFIFMYFRCENIKLTPTECETENGLYSVKPNLTGVTATTCGTNLKENCEFTAATLGDAIHKCDTTIGCNMFSYDFNTSKMYIIDHTKNTTNSSIFNLYTKRTHAITGTTTS